MKIAILHGSPRIDGDSDTLAKAFIEASEQTRDTEVRHFRLHEMNIAPCLGCLHCKDAIDHKCSIEDDMEYIYAVFEWAEVVVWATPMYWGYMTAQMKTALDRMEALVWRNGWNEKTFAALLTYHCHVESTVAFFKRVCPYFHVKLHVVTCLTIDEHGRDVPATQCTEALDNCRALAIGL